ncbi:MAG: recombination mediator RecR [Verrucomicrobiota bacterium]|nr:recombination mediator RecR [Verrucomicrobiota bacterium]
MNSTIENLIAAFNRLPGLGRRTSERIAFMLVQDKYDTLETLIKALQKSHENITICKICGSITTVDCNPCEICINPKRDKNKICVVESSEELFKIESSKAYDGVYHLLNGKISPISGVGINDLRIKELYDRISLENSKEVIFCLGDDVESAATMNYLKEKIKFLNKNVSCINLSLIDSTPIEYVDAKTLGIAISQRIRI